MRLSPMFFALVAAFGSSRDEAAYDADRLDDGFGLGDVDPSTPLDGRGDSVTAHMSLAGFHQTGASQRLARGYKGRSLYALLDNFYWDTVINSYPQAAQVDTITVDTATNSFAYTLTVVPEAGDSVTVTYTAAGSTSTAAISAGLVAAWNVDPVARGIAVAADATGSFTLTGITEGIGFTVTLGTNKLSIVHTVANTDADSVGFARGVIMLARDLSTTGDGEKLGGLPVAARLTAQVETLTVVYAAGEVYYVTITMEDEVRTVAVAADTDTATTTTAIVTAIDAVMEGHPAGAGYSVDASSTGAGNVTLTSEVPGKAFAVEVGTKSGTATRLVLAHTTVGPTTDVWKMFQGFASAVYDTESAGTAYPDAYPPNSAMKVQRSDAIWLESSESPTSASAAYLETVAGATCGRVYTTGSATRIKFPKGSYEWLGMSNGASGSDLCQAFTFNRFNTP